jgi:membrane associated rhomboid family serine protease
MAFVYHYALFPRAITTGVPTTPFSIQPVYLTLITSMFLHGGLLHIAGNMLFLWIFGNNVEDVMGRFKFTAFYLMVGVAGALAQIAISPFSAVPNIGASGAIAGVLASYLIMFPGARVLTFVFFIFIEVIRLPAFILIGFWFILQIVLGVFSFSTAAGAGAGVAYFAHIGGFAAGLLITILLLKLPRRFGINQYHNPPENNW